MAPTMPNKNHSSAPKFDGKAGSLSMFLDEVEQLAVSCELTPKQTIEWVIHYAPGGDEHELWSSLDTSTGDNWGAFKRELFAQYPGSTGDRKYSVADLEILTEKQATGLIMTSEQFGTFYRLFTKISRFLKAKNKLNDREISSLFMRGFDYAFRLQVRAQLRAENPKHHSDDPYTLSQICEAALFILSCNHDNVDTGALLMESAAAASSTIKRERFDLSSISSPLQTSGINVNALALELIKNMGLQTAVTVAQTNQSGGYNSSAAPNVPRFCSNDCSFCSDSSHYQHSCPRVSEYIQKGLCIRNNENYIVLPNGTRVTPRTAPGRNIMERLDNWHKSNPSSTNTVSSNFVASDLDCSWSLPTTTAFTEARQSNDEDLPLATGREMEDLELLESLITSTQKKVDETKRKMNASKLYTGPTTRNMTKSNSHDPAKALTPTGMSTPAVNSGASPQYRYTMPIEDPKIVGKLLKCTLDAPVTLSSRELLAVAPDVELRSV
ncbi:hypothetical protein CVT25_005597 [Psilocybe cyanescens]|uniref:CCHC-type domain-containing protein n=1 Tax=Psilocybe cyanescens TaxID=93625 RepID=A0A409W947_PSICY|nr:hypothetical protein CVT25_005597 [Psilocybe cyanescens]